MKRRKLLYESFDFNEDQQKAEVEASDEIKFYQTYEGASKEEVEAWLKLLVKDSCLIGSYEVTPSGINVNGDINFVYKLEKEIPFKFNEVTGNFNCAYNNLETLKRSPNIVGKNFLCYGNLLTSLEGAPNTVNMKFDCYGNLLKNLKGSPKYVGKDYDCSQNRLVSLEGGPTFVGGYFICTGNELNPVSKPDWMKVTGDFYG